VLSGVAFFGDHFSSVYSYAPNGDTTVFEGHTDATGFRLLDALAAGSLVDGTNIGTANGQYFLRDDAFKSTPAKGDWLDMNPHYMGLRFTSGLTNYFAWLNVKVVWTTDAFGLDTVTTTFIDWAYDTTGAPIKAGDTGATPEPSTFALLATGAIGLAVLRRRRFQKA